MEKERKTERRTRRGKTDEESAPLGCVLRSAKSGAAAERKVAFERKRKCAVFSLFLSLSLAAICHHHHHHHHHHYHHCLLSVGKPGAGEKKPPLDRPSFPPDWISDGTVYIRAQRRFFLSLCTLRKHCAYDPCLHVCMSTMPVSSHYKNHTVVLSSKTE